MENPKSPDLFASRDIEGDPIRDNLEEAALTEEHIGFVGSPEDDDLFKEREQKKKEGEMKILSKRYDLTGGDIAK
jgi:hypothetical protein